jgi:hypothetical protein
LLDARLKFPGRLNVVGQDEDLLGKQAFLRLEKPFDTLDNDARLACSRTGYDYRRSIAELDDAALFRRQRKGLGLLACRQRYGDGKASWDQYS